MPSKSENPYAALNRVFHEPSRLAILSALIGVEEGLTFSQLKRECDLTDGNLSRHLKTLEEAGVIEIEKRFVRNKPQTRVILTEGGRENFLQYLKALEEVLLKAAESFAAQQKEESVPISLLGLKLQQI